MVHLQQPSQRSLHFLQFHLPDLYIQDHSSDGLAEQPESLHHYLLHGPGLLLHYQ